MQRARLHTPSLRVRVVAAGMITWVVLILSLDVFVFLSLRTQLLNSLDDLVAARAALAQELGATLSPEQLDARLTELGVPAVVTAADGRVLAADPAAPGFGDGPPGPVLADLSNSATDELQLPNGVTVTVFGSRSGVDETLDQVLIFESIGTVGVLLLMLVLLVRTSRVLLQPIDHVVVTAQHIAAGRTGERLRPDRPDTELGRLALAFDVMLDSLEGAVDQAQTAEREARDAEVRSRRFLADAAHQLRTPVAALRASVEALVRTHQPQEQQRLLDNLVRESARTSRLISSLLRVAELDRGDNVVRTRCDLVALIGEEVVRTRNLTSHLTIELRHQLDAVTIEADPDSIREALSNVLDNARRHAARRVTVDVAIVAGDAEIRVADDGPGLPPGQEDRVFERFATFDGRGGSGLGLAIARAIAQAHEGDLSYRERGFVFRIPIAGSSITSDMADRAPGR